MLGVPEGYPRDVVVYLFLFYPIRDWDCVTHRPSTSRLYFDVDVDFTSLFFIFDMRHGDMDDALGDTHLRSPPHRFIRTSTLAGSSLSSRIWTPSQTSPTVVSHYATRSDQLTCMIHPALVTSVLVVRAYSPSMEGLLLHRHFGH